VPPPRILAVSKRHGVWVRGTTNGNARGSSADRRSRKVWLLATYDPDLGPDEARCAFGCGTILTLETVTVDRHPTPGAHGGTYARDNIRPACGPCNSTHGGAVRSPVNIMRGKQ
jgi:hypothetical protein